MQKNEEARRCVDFGDSILLMPAEVYELTMQSDLPYGTYSLMDGIARLYGVNALGDSKCLLTSMMTAAFVAGCAYAGVKEGTGHDIRN
ncbi:hypothetical protein H6B15_14775 [Gemmiger formicilis]|uniref:hypothetical protein n=1 Tax=Gemmiger formicilis TaxID=745368 RepID=UPI0019577733|nr:hypothetical protein [Gemmiger formicilis]MBM6717920.1 hypothetical protein [Gemmiger formicilis]